MFSLLPPIAPPDAPSHPGWWPLPLGWWLVGLALFLFMMWGLSRVLQRGIAGWQRRMPQPSTREMAMAALDELAGRGEVDDRDVAYRLNEILRAALLDTDAEERWHPFPPVADVGVSRAAWEAFWEELEMRYRRPDGGHDADRQRQWLAVARGWLEQLPEPHGIGEPR